MVEKDDWRLLNDVEYLKKANINPTDGGEICEHAPHLKCCEFCLEPVQDNIHQWWFVPSDLSCCICEECYNDFKDEFEWRILDGWDIEWCIRCPECGEILGKTSISEDYGFDTWSFDAMADMDAADYDIQTKI